MNNKVCPPSVPESTSQDDVIRFQRAIGNLCYWTVSPTALSLQLPLPLPPPPTTLSLRMTSPHVPPNNPSPPSPARGGETWEIRARRGVGINGSTSLGIGVMGILNITPDSFSDGGVNLDPGHAIEAAAAMVEAGACTLDIGGESTRPGSLGVAPEEQLARVIPVIKGLRASGSGGGGGGGRRLAQIPISIDTTSSVVARHAMECGADVINDVSGGEDDPAILEVAAKYGAGVILMHRIAKPRDDAYSDAYGTTNVGGGGGGGSKPRPVYADVVESVIGYLRDVALPRAMRAGIDPAKIMVDPGLGFGKSVEDNLALIRGTDRIAHALGRPILSGLSRKSFVGRVCLQRDSSPEERGTGTVALSVLHAMIARQAGAGMLWRVHDVPAHVQALRAMESVI